MSDSVFLNKLVTIAQKFGSQIHLRSIRDGFAVIIPLFILAGLAVLVNNVIIDPEGFLSNIISSDTLTLWQDWGELVNNATLNIASLLISIAIAYYLASNKQFENPFSAAIVALSVSITILPINTSINPIDSEQTVEVTGIIEFTKISTEGMFAGIIVGLLATELFMFISKSDRLKIKLGQGVPPAVVKSFNVMIPLMIVVSIFALVSFLLQGFFNTNFVDLIGTLIQAPLKAIGTSLPGYLFIYSVANLFFSAGVHQAVISGPILEPLLISNIQENMTAFSNGSEIPNIINYSFHNVYGLTGGSGNTFALLVAIFIFGKSKVYKDVGKLGGGPGLFNINEPIIFGLPIVFNLPMMIPFVLVPTINLALAYFATAVNLIDKMVIMVPWTTPPLISAYLATAGDWKSVVFQLCLIILSVAIYLPFLRISERVLYQQN